ncbi:hypothetical protein VCRA2133E348_210073 [Vibrio crassostreae]|nr:hypothetical protein VCRA2119O48_200076 [Vibrio crassostreae]CAK2772182.1 hypothetical protein VCRA2133E348_210073 [Vibrio crassostreae]CAK3220159.1 hypothetical protein VCRA213O314_190027 [Vibrio crassostreae]CAK3840169.1 hypothetical protein VCRA212O16_210076 [Vibrio crassostreae]
MITANYDRQSDHQLSKKSLNIVSYDIKTKPILKKQPLWKP